jgi:hypothetical protein
VSAVGFLVDLKTAIIFQMAANQKPPAMRKDFYLQLVSAMHMQ